MRKSSTGISTSLIAIVLVACLLVGLLAGCGNGGLSGKYYLDGDKNSDYIEFKGGGKFVGTDSGLKVSGTYKVDGNTVTITFSIMGFSDSSDYTISADHMTLTGQGTLMGSGDTYIKK